MRTLGLIGGTGWVSTIEYYRLINELTNERLGGLNAARLMIYSVNYNDFEKMSQRNDTPLHDGYAETYRTKTTSS